MGKVLKSNKEPITYILSHKVDRVLSKLSLLVIPVLLIVLLNNFSYILLTFTFILSGLIIFICWWYHNYRIVISSEKIVLHNLITKVFEIRKIQQLVFEDFGYISILYNDKTHKITGYIGWWSLLPIAENNQELIEIISRKVVKLTQKNKLIYNNTSGIAEKRMWPVVFLSLYLIISIICFVFLISNWNTVVFFIATVIFVVSIVFLINKLFTPRKIIVYNHLTKEIFINKLFKTIILKVDEITDFSYSFKANLITFKLKNKKRISVLGIRDMDYACNKLRTICKLDYGCPLFY